MNDKYILNGHEVVKCPDLFKWGEWFQTANRIVARDKLDNIEISTVFLGLDHQFGAGLPLLFETMIFGGPNDNETWRCSTWKEAEEQHKKVVTAIKQGTALP